MSQPVVGSGIETSELDSEPVSANPLLSMISRLVPASGLQFIDLEIPTAALAATTGKFVEDVDPIDGPYLIPLADRADDDGVEWHPVTGASLRPEQTLWVNGYQAVERLCGRWLPLPYFRYLGRDGDGCARFDDGPFNWVRIFIAQPLSSFRDAEAVKAVLVIDTDVDRKGRMEQADYAAPNLDDVVFAPVFKLASGADQVAGFLGLDWVDTWLRSAADNGGPFNAADRQNSMDGRTSNGAFTLEHVARYMTLIDVLAYSRRMPRLQFVDIRAVHWTSRQTQVDLVLDIGSRKTTASLVDVSPGRSMPDALPTCESVKLRDLSRPTLIHDGTIATVAEFRPAEFGDEFASRHSGRDDPFKWPSVVRVGEEGLRHALSPSAAPGQTGLYNVMRGLAQTAPYSELWRFANEDEASERSARMVAGTLLSHLTEDGDVISLADGGAAAALRPHFSPSSIVAMFIGECMLHALAQLNEPASLGAGHFRVLRRVVVVCPVTASEQERRLLLERASAAIQLVWQTQNWSEDATGLVPARPQAALGVDASLAAQIVYLHDEIEIRALGNVNQVIERAGRSGGDGTRAREIRVASLDISGMATGLSIVRYQLKGDGGLNSKIELADRIAIAGDSLNETIVKSCILPAIARALDASGHRDGTALLTRLGERLGSEGALVDRHFSARFLRKVLLPAASAVIDTLSAMPERRAAPAVRFATLGHLVRLGDGRMAPLDRRLEQLAESEGAREFRLAEVRVPIDARILVHDVKAHFGEVIARACNVMRARRADILVWSGVYAYVPGIKDLLLRHLPLAPHRIIRAQSTWDDLGEERTAAGLGDANGRFLTTVAAALAARPNGNAMARVAAAVANELENSVPPRQSIGILSSGNATASLSREHVPWLTVTKAPDDTSYQQMPTKIGGPDEPGQARLNADAFRRPLAPGPANIPRGGVS